MAIVSRETWIVTGAGVAAIVLLYLLSALTQLPDWAVIAVAIVVGVILPQFLNDYFG